MTFVFGEWVRNIFLIKSPVLYQLTSTIVDVPEMAKTVQIRVISPYQRNVHRGGISVGPIHFWRKFGCCTFRLDDALVSVGFFEKRRTESDKLLFLREPYILHNDLCSRRVRLIAFVALLTKRLIITTERSDLIISYYVLTSSQQFLITACLTIDVFVDCGPTPTPKLNYVTDLRTYYIHVLLWWLMTLWRQTTNR